MFSVLTRGCLLRLGRLTIKVVFMILVLRCWYSVTVVSVALLAVSRLLMTSICLFGWTVLLRTLTIVLLHLSVQVRSTMALGSPFPPWTGMKLADSRRVIVFFRTKLCVLRFMIPLTLMFVQGDSSRLIVTWNLCVLVNSAAMLWNMTFLRGKLMTSWTQLWMAPRGCATGGLL